MSAALDAMAKALPQYRIAFSNVDLEGNLTVLHSRNVPEIPFLEGLRTNIAAAPLFLEGMFRLECVVVEDPRASELEQELSRAEPRLGAAGARLFCPFDEAAGRVTLVTLTRAQPGKWDSCLVETVREAGEFIHLLRREARTRAQAISKAKFAAIGEMASGIAHEINNPLAVIDGLGRQLRELEAEKRKANPTVLAHLSTIEKMVGRITAITKGLRTFSRQSDRDPLAPVVLSSLIAEAAAIFGARAEREGADFEIIAPTAHLRVSGRSSELLQVLINLLNNALDATEGMAERKVQLRVRQIDGVVELSVRDSGPGVPQALRESVFLPFFTTKEVGRGTGLGLSISKRIIEDHGGHLILDPSQPSTTFVVELPLESE